MGSLAQAGLTIALVIAALIVFSSARGRSGKRGPFLGMGMSIGGGSEKSATCKPVSFGPDAVWLAVRCTSSEEVVDGLRVRHARWADWDDGLADATLVGRVFISQPVDGWVLVVSASLPDLGGGGRPDKLTPLLVRLSRKLATIVQYFGSYRATGYYAWVWVDQGEVLRGFAGQKGTHLLDVGSKTPIEKEMTAVDEQAVQRVAGAWSLDPLTLGDRQAETVLGWLGRF